MLKVALLGLGLVAEKIHLPACRMIPDIEVIAACDPQIQRRELLKSQIPRLYESAELLFANENPDIVIVGAPPQYHAQLSIQALENGADVICEKPFAETLEQADRMITFAKRNDRFIAVNTQYRFMGFYDAVLSEIAKESYGQPYMIQGWQQMFHPANDDKLEWRKQLKRSTLFDFGSHPIDLACRMFGALPLSVSAFMPNVMEEYDSDVLVHLVLSFPENRLATLTFNRVSHAPERYMEMRIDCPKASMRVSLGGVARASLDMVRWKESLKPRLRASLLKGGEARVECGAKSSVLAREAHPVFAKATARLINQFISSRRADSDYSDVEFSREILNVILAAYQSAQQMSPVSLSSTFEMSK